MFRLLGTTTRPDEAEVSVDRRHTDREYESELQQLRELLLMMGGRVEVMIGESAAALLDRDPDRALRAMRADHDVDVDEMEVDRRCLEILARRQPLASDLRFVAQALKMVVDLERIGDLAQHLGQRVVDFGPDRSFPLPDEVPRMAELARSLVRDAMDALARSDRALAERAIARDAELDLCYQQVQRRVLDMMRKDHLSVDDGIRTQKVVKYLERIGDHATNIAEKVIFLLSGQDVRHGGDRAGSR